MKHSLSSYWEARSLWTRNCLRLILAASFLLPLMIFGWGAGCNDNNTPTGPSAEASGRQIFRFDTFGDEQFWRDTLRMHEVIQTAVDPTTALSVGLKVDADAVSAGFLDTADLTSPATTVALLKQKAVVGVIGTFQNDSLVGVGVTCALCHSTVDNSVMPGIGKRLDGWPNKELNPGLILSLSPAMQDPAVQAVLTSWGPGRYDPRWNLDHINGPVLIPPAYGLQGVPLSTYTGDGPISYWNHYVAVTQMHGHGSFSDPRIGVNIVQTPDMVTSKLPNLQAYQLSLLKPAVDSTTFDTAAATRGKALFEGKAACSTCHIPPTFTDAGSKLHAPSETGMDPLYASRSATKLYRTTPLRALALHPPYFHDGSAPTLEAVVNHYVSVLSLTLTGSEKTDLVEYLKSL